MQKMTVTYHPGVLQRDHMVDINIRRGSPRIAVVRTLPRPGGRVAVRANGNASPIALQDRFSRAATAGLDPVRK